MRDLSKVIDEEIKYDVVKKIENIAFEIKYQLLEHSDYLTKEECYNLLSYGIDIEKIAIRLKEEL